MTAKKQEIGMPDFEIRYYHADGKLAVVHMCACATIDDAHILAEANIGEHARFEIVDRAAQPGGVR
ncbi:MAG: hypothetical protein ACTHPD_17340 [Rhizomicrobium sp.]